MRRERTVFPRPSEAKVLEAARAVVELATLALEPEYLVWDKSVNLGVVEGVWNAASFGDEARLVLPADGHLAGLIERLMRVRKKRWPKVDFLVFALDMRHEGEEILFTFELTFDEGESFHPCEIAWDMPLAGPADRN